MATLYRQAHILGQLHQALVGDRGKDRGRLRCHVGIVLDTKEVGRTALVDILLLLGVEVELARVAQVVSQLVGLHRSGIVATHLVDTGAERSRAVILADYHIGIGRETTLEVGTYGHHEYHKQVLVGRMHAHLRTCADEQRTDVERSTTLIGRHKALVHLYHLEHHLAELLGRKLRHQDAIASAL